MGNSWVVMPQWTWASASFAGTSHLKSDLRLQDAFSCSKISIENNEFFYSVISDGAGSASHGGEGASIVSRTFALEIRKFLSNGARFPSLSIIESWIDIARDRIYSASCNRKLIPRDFASTLVCIISNSFSSVIIHIGDGAVVIHDKNLNEWQVPIWPSHGEYASTTFFVTDEIFPNLKTIFIAKEIDCIVSFSDGLERLALDFNLQKAHIPFFDSITKPVFDSNIKGKDFELSKLLKKYLNSPSINARTDDDKSLIISVYK
jgi:hypothetical protein